MRNKSQKGVAAMEFLVNRNRIRPISISQATPVGEGFC